MKIRDIINKRLRLERVFQQTRREQDAPSYSIENMIVFPKSELSKRMREKILALEVDESLTFQLKLFMDQLEVLESKKKEIEKQIKIIGVQYYKQVEILTSIVGISVLSALAIMADVCDINRFPNQEG